MNIKTNNKASMDFFSRPENQRWLPKAPGRRPLSTYDLEKEALARQYMGLEAELAVRERSLLDAAAEYWQQSQAEAEATTDTASATQETPKPEFGYGRPVPQRRQDQSPPQPAEPTPVAAADSGAEPSPTPSLSAEDPLPESDPATLGTGAAALEPTREPATETDELADHKADPATPKESARAFDSKQVAL